MPQRNEWTLSVERIKQEGSDEPAVPIGLRLYPDLTFWVNLKRLARVVRGWHLDSVTVRESSGQLAIMNEFNKPLMLLPVNAYRCPKQTIDIGELEA